MKKEIKVPPVGESITQGVIGKILKPEGSFTRVDEELLEIETDKVNQPIYALDEGIVYWKIKEGELVQIGQVIGYIDEQRAPISVKEKEPLPSTPIIIPPTEKKQTSAKTPVVSTKSSVRKSIEESLYAQESHDMSMTSPPHAPVSSIQPSPESNVIKTPMTSLRKTIAERLVKAKNQTAMLTTFNELDMTAVLKIREKEQELFTKRYGVKLGFMSFFIKAAVSALKEFPLVNSWIEEDQIVTSQKYDICIAVSTEKGLIVPVVRDCDKKSFGALEKEVALYAKKAREGKISLDEMRGGSFTITNGGVFGSMLSTPILNPPQSAILGMHTIVKRAVVHQDQIVIRPMMYLALSYDHRIIDGKEAIQFLVHMKHNLEEPTRMLLEGPLAL